MCIKCNLWREQNKDRDKAQRYLDLLDTARCNGRWQDVPELARKVEKHVPQRKCLVLTARSECMIASVRLKLFPIPSSLSPTATASLSSQIQVLSSAVENETTFPEDAFQGSVCLAYLYWAVGEPSVALSRIPSDLATISQRLAKNGRTLSGWTHVCIVKGAYIRGLAQEKLNNLGDAMETYNSINPYVSSVQSRFGTNLEHRSTTVQFMHLYCLLIRDNVALQFGDHGEPLYPTAMIGGHALLSPFRTWASICETEKSSGVDSRSQLPFLPLGREVWRAYYDMLTMLLHYRSKGESRSAGYITLEENISNAALSTEMRRVEEVYEAILLGEISFPKANEANPEIETWTDQVMTNWAVQCAPTWEEEDLEPGGKSAMSKRILAILYRAATRTFHSTRILRHLFTVHAALAEIELAKKALDSYIELVTRGNARVEKSGKKEIGVDDDGTVLLTVATGIRTLCVHGHRKEAKRAQELVKLAQQWLQKHEPDDTQTPVKSADDVPQDLVDQSKKANPPVSRVSLASAHRAIGLSEAHWSRQTYQPSERDALHLSAISSLQTAAQLSSTVDQELQSAYNLALAYADKRDIDGAIASIKVPLSSSPADANLAEGEHFPNLSQTVLSQDFWRRRTLLRCWHLLALLLTAKQNYSAAVGSCEAGFELYGGDPALLGESHNTRMSKLGLLEKQDIMELKKTELALTEVIEGPEAAVNASGELLALYAKFFEHPEPLAPTPQTVDSTSTPESGSKSFRNSIFGRSKNSIHRRPQLDLASGTESANLQLSSLEKPSSPAMQVTHDGAADQLTLPVNGHAAVRVESRKLHKRQSRKSMVGSVRKSGTSSPARLSTAKSTNQPNFNLPSRSRPTTGTEENQPPSNPTFNSSDEVGVAVSHNGPSSKVFPSSSPSGPSTSNPFTGRSSNNNATQSQSGPEQKSATGFILHQPVFPPPELFFPPHETTRHSLTLLVQIWIMISSLYRRASMPTDASAALAEARTHARSIETLVVQHHGSSNESFTTSGWTGAKAIAEVWADVYTEEAMHALAKGDSNEASDRFEEALLWWPDQPSATVGLCNLLLDFYAGPTTPATQDPERPLPPSTLHPAPSPTLPPPQSSESANAEEEQAALLSRLAARDRAYGLLSALTKNGQGWDCSEAWTALARAYELGGQREKALEAYWWVVELEDSRGVRGWEVVGGW